MSVGRDCRLTSDGYAQAVIAGVRATGVDVVDIGTCPTPLMYFSLFHWQLDGGLQVTGSHNPSDYNGFKICLGTESLHGDRIQDLRRRIEAGRFPQRHGGARAPTRSSPSTRTTSSRTSGRWPERWTSSSTPGTAPPGRSRRRSTDDWGAGHRALLRPRWTLPEPPSGSDRRREPRGAPRARGGVTGRGSASRSTGTPTASASSVRWVG